MWFAQVVMNARYHCYTDYPNLMTYYGNIGTREHRVIPVLIYTTL